MRNLRFLLLCVSVVIGASKFQALGEPVNPAKSQKNDSQETPDNPTQSPAPSFVRATELIGIPVKNPQNEPLGQLRDLAIDLPSGRITYAVFATGGVLGFGEKYFAIPASLLRFGSDSRVLILNANKEILKSAQGMNRNNWPTAADPQWTSEGYAAAGSPGMRINEAAGADRPKQSTSGSTDNSSANIRQPESIKEAGTTAPADPAQIKRASEIVGLLVKDGKGERLGQIDDLAIHLQSEKVLYAVLSSGGLLGLGEKRVAIAPSAFTISAEDESVLIAKVNRNALASAAGFDKANWPTQPDKTLMVEGYQFHGQNAAGPEEKSIREPAGTQADTTRKNAVDEDAKILTAGDQSNAKPDLLLTQSIRKAVVANDSLSMLAKNVTIITIDGKVTLRGVVRSIGEKETISSHAREIAGENNVEDQLEIDAD